MQYKTKMTKRKIYTINIALFLVYTIAGVLSFVFYRRDFSKQDRCRVFSMLKKTAYLGVFVLFFSLGCGVMFLNYVLIICKLTRSRISMRDGTSGTSVKMSKNNVKLTRAIIMTLTAYILLYTPIVSVTCVRTFIVDSLGHILDDIALLFYFSNNLVNRLTRLYII